jgi:metallophosphoesterase superfamily enzyme
MELIQEIKNDRNIMESAFRFGCTVYSQGNHDGISSGYKNSLQENMTISRKDGCIAVCHLHSLQSPI